MNPIRSLFLKILLWFFMSLLLLVVILAGFFNLDFRLRPDSALITGLGGQGKALGRVILRELYDSSYYEWGSILVRFGKAYDLELLLCHSDGRILVGPNRAIPDRVTDALGRVEKDPVRDSQPRPHPPSGFNQRPGRGAPPRHGRPPSIASREDGGRRPFRLLPLPPPERLRFTYLLRTSDPSRYWAYVSFPFHERPERPPEELFLLAASPSVTGNGLFFNPLPWLLLAGFVLAISILLWIPLVKNITRPIGRITRAAEKIARGNFNVHVDDKRADEIGRLGAAINHMSGQLENLVMGQKRFLGDIAHELASPIARMNLGLSILEQRLKGEDLGRLEDIAEEVRHMSNLINELLSFTRAEIGPERLAAKTIPLGPMVLEIMDREGAAGVEMLNRVENGVLVWGVESLLRRALSNILRNAVRYAGDQGPIEMGTKKEGDRVLVAITDRGPGVPEASIPHLFEPFYRPEAVRDRKSGGVGLGLAIVKTCVQACGGTVRAENLSPRGFSITMALFESRPEKTSRTL
ncbi:MAG: HAMP domain-containing histidine kinase [Deltaproteobacteria bacterium]|nr:HAMP domain-containing histidine kinase [Deltaproteobacteria bacterium]